MEKRLVVLFIILSLLFFVSPNVYAEDEIYIDSVSIESISESAEVNNDATYSGLNLNFDVKFENVNDYVTYKIIINNETHEDYEIDESSMNNDDIITYEYSYDDDNKILESNGKSLLFITIRYNKEVSFQESEKENYIDNKVLVLDLQKKEENPIKIDDEVSPTPTVNPVNDEDVDVPDTFSEIDHKVALIVLLSFLLIIVLFLSKERSYLLVLLIMLLPISVLAIERVKITINSKVEISAPSPCGSFRDDSWNKIHNNIVNNEISCYHVGDTKEIVVGEYGKHILRISNMSTPDVCKQEGFSQTACGFVLEFKDIPLSHVYNNSGNNYGGWESSEIRTYLNNDFYNMLDESLKNIIISTFTVSGHEINKTDNYETTDYLYLLSTAEVWEGGRNWDTGRTMTRQLDYYKDNFVTGTNCGEAIKYYNSSSGTIWWLRNPSYKSNNYTASVYLDGTPDQYRGHTSLVFGISPAFRIG